MMTTYFTLIIFLFVVFKLDHPLIGTDYSKAPGCIPTIVLHPGPPPGYQSTFAQALVQTRHRSVDPDPSPAYPL